MKQLFLISVLLLGLAACSGQAENPADTVVKYLQAKVTGNRSDIQALLCSSMEPDLEREVLSFNGLGAQLKGVSCKAGSSTDTVTCSGSIVANYGTEQRSFPLSTYRVVREAGKLKWCGESR